jgi:hypothetical protein
MYLGSKHEPTYAFQEKRHFAENWWKSSKIANTALAVGTIL